MRILYLCADRGVPVLGRKGASAHVRELASALGRAGADVVVAAAQLTQSPWETPAVFHVPVVHLPASEHTLSVFDAVKRRAERLSVETAPASGVRRILYDEELPAQLRRRFAQSPPDLVYERASLHSTAGAVLADELDVPLAVELNAPLGLEQDTYRGDALAALAAAAERRTLHRADAVFAVSDLLREHAVSLGVDAGRVHVLPNAVDPERFRPAESAGRNGGPILGFVGGLRPWHGVGAFPELLARLRERFPDVRLVLAGDGPQRAELEEELADKGLDAHVVFTGPVPHDEVPELVRRLDVALVPYDRLDHSFYFSPLKLFEAMACGVPVVAARIGQIAEIVEDGQTGLLYEPGDAAALAEACERLLADPDLRGRIGAAAAELVRRENTWERNAERVLEVASRLRR